ncbi:MAG: hypothetical protein GY893_10330 [bacterium]|nr:hypothetical protein [bacterium]
MKKILTFVLTLALAAVMSGCVQMDMETNIEKDGSGTMEMTLSFSSIVTETINELGIEEMSDDLGQLHEFTKMDQGELKKKLKVHDVKLINLSQDMVNGRETTTIKLGFNDLEGLAFAMYELMEDSNEGLAILDNGDGNYVLKTHTYDWPEIAEKEIEVEMSMDSMADLDFDKIQNQMELMGRMMGAISELDMKMKITVPGNIVESNAHKVEGRTSIWAIDSSNMTSEDGDMEPHIVFSSKGLSLKPQK